MHDASAAPPAEFKDRRTALIIFGILLILSGCLTAVMVLFSLIMRPLIEGPFIPFLFMLLTPTVALIWLGIGSIYCRRWARALILACGWIWLILGTEKFVLLTIIGLGHARPSLGEFHPELRLAIEFILGICFGLLILVPLVLVLFYQSRHVRATCEIRDPARCWTDACPTPVLTLSIFLAIHVAFVPHLILSSKSVVPFFGSYVSGLPAKVILIVTLAGFGFSAWTCFKLRIAGWWAALASYTLSTLSFIITVYCSGTPGHKLAYLPPSQLEEIKLLSSCNSPWLWLSILLGSLPLLGLILYTKGFFKNSDVESSSGPHIH